MHRVRCNKYIKYCFGLIKYTSYNLNLSVLTTTKRINANINKPVYNLEFAFLICKNVYLYLIFQILSDDISRTLRFAMIVNVTFSNIDMNKRIIKLLCLKFLSLTPSGGVGGDISLW